MGSERRSPLAAWTDRLASVAVQSGDRLSVSELAYVSQVNMRLDATASEVVSNALGVAIPTEPNKVASGDELAVLWLGPDEWLVVGPPGTAGDIEAGLWTSMAGHPGAVVDVSAQRTTLVVTGLAASDVLAHGCALDLHVDVFGVDRCAQTMLARAQVILWRRATDEFRVLVRASYASYLAAWLLDAATEYVGARDQTRT